MISSSCAGDGYDSWDGYWRLGGCQLVYKGSREEEPGSLALVLLLQGIASGTLSFLRLSFAFL